MRISIISDMHGNCIAFDAVLADINQQRVDQTVCLGDAIQGGPQPAQVVSRLQEIGCPMVMGNADAFLLTGHDEEDAHTPAERLRKLNEIREWSVGQLSAEDLAFMRSFQSTITLELNVNAGRKLLCFHGSPASFNDVILPTTPEEDFQRLLGGHNDDILCGGHTHMQQIRRLGDSFFFNPGSVGFAYSRQQDEANFRADAWAEYAILTARDGKLALEFRRVPFDVGALIRIYRSCGRPYTEEAVAQYQPK